MKHIPRVFYANRRSAGKSPQPAIQRHATRLLRRVAHDLRLRTADHEIVSQTIGAGLGCRVTLRAPGLLLEVGQKYQSSDVAVAFRHRRTTRDMAGGRPNAVSFGQLASPEGYQSLLTSLGCVSGTKR